MSQKNKGYFLAEMLLAITAFLIAAAVMLPYSILIITQIVQQREDAEATHILFDELMHIKAGGIESGRGLVVKHNLFYQVLVIKEDSGNIVEVCIHYDGENQENRKKCAFVE